MKMKTNLETDIFNYKTPEFFINMKNIPDKTSRERKSFVLEEKRKCKEGININGINIPGSLYFHLNYYHLQRDATEKELLSGSDKKIISLPNLRDNEWIVFNDYDQVSKNPQIYTLCGARQLIKTEFECSITLRELSIFKNTEALGVFQADEDKDTFVKKMRIAIEHGQPFIIVPNIDKDWGKKEIRFGYTKQDGSAEIKGVLYLYNTQEGKKIQVGSGKTVTHFFGDEVAKSNFRAVYDAIEPALLSDTGKLRCVPLFTFTGGEAKKAEDAKNLVLYPNTKTQFTTIVEDKVVGARVLFGQYRKDCKKPMKFSDYVDIKTNTWLDDYTILVTDFDYANQVIDDELEAAAQSPDPSTLMLKKVFFPRKLEDIFLVEGSNNFPLEAIIQRQDWLKENYKPERIELYKDINLKVKWRFSSLELITKFPVNASDNKLAPVQIFEYPIDGLPLGTYCMGVDSINSNESSDRINSLATAYILKRTHDPLGKFQYHIVASYAGRPKLVTEFYELCEMLAEMYNAYILPEFNQSFVDHFVNQNKGYVLWDTPQLSIDIKQTAFSSKMSSHKKGLNPTPINQQFGMDLAVTYSKAPIDYIEDRKVMSRVLGVNRIYDYMLLEEMKNYKSKPSSSKGIHDGNYDRCFTEGHKIMTKEGYKDISEIVVNDIVLSHDGSYNKVFKLFKSNFNGNLISLKPLGNDKVINSTPNHPFLIGRYSKKPRGRSWMKRKDNLDIIDWVEAKDIKKGDFFFIPNKKERIERTLNDDVLYLLGWYLSDGNISKSNCLRICFQGDQIEMAIKCKEILEKYDEFLPSQFEITHHMTGKKFKSHKDKKKPSIKKIPNKFAYILDCTSHWFNNVVKEYITLLKGGEKILNQNLVNQKNLLPLILGFFEGDGHQTFDKLGRSSLQLSGTYLTMIYQFREIILNEGIWCTISPTKSKDKNHNNQLRIDIQDWKGINRIVEKSLKFKTIPLNRKQRSNVLKKDNGFWVPLKKIESVDYQGFVYNCEVENTHSYTVDFIATHNCIAFYHALILANHLDKYLPMDKFISNKDKKEEPRMQTPSSPFSSINRQLSSSHKKTGRSPFLSI